MVVVDFSAEGALLKVTPHELFILRSALLRESNQRSLKYERSNPSTPEELLSLASNSSVAKSLKTDIIKLMQFYKDQGVVE